jgi:hypothetical protein
MAARRSEPKKGDLELTAVRYALSDATRLQIGYANSEPPLSDVDVIEHGHSPFALKAQSG